ncbi:MAG: family efflux transporter subunit [Chlamydiales bacterium]|jgi:membrane fusion protein (multidrug efflux system)|nr:family efflux transporter subunit [Chlamydiales bacterium]
MSHIKKNSFSHLFLLAAFATGCQNQPPVASLPPPPPAPSVHVQHITLADMPIARQYPGRAAPSSEVDVLARVTGVLLKRFYNEGEVVKLGDPLAELDAAPFEADFAKAQAAFIEAESRRQRALTLEKYKAISVQERDEAILAYESAKSDLKNAEINLKYTKIDAPISGISSENPSDEGSLLEAGGLIASISQLDPISVVFAFPDTEWLKWRQEAEEGKVLLPEQFTASIFTADGMKHPYEGIVDFTESAIDRATGSVKAKATIPNPKLSLLPGQFVKVSLQGIVKPQAIAVPEQAIMYSAKGPFIYKLTAKNEVEVCPVELGPLSKEGRIIEKGLESSDRIITEGMIKARPGQTVKVDEKADAPCSCHQHESAKGGV